MLTAFDRADRDRVDHEECLEARFDREQSADFAEHGSHLNSLSTERANAGFEPCTC
jgi:hypothetical protein